MKKLTGMILAMLMVMSMFALTVSADAAANVTVTITNGDIVMKPETIAVTDKDGDGALTINDALIAAHDAKYTGGAEAGYETALGDWGLSINKLWGVENGGSYGYYLNNGMAMGLADPVNEGDSLTAFVYVDPFWSDMYCYFDKTAAEVKTGEEITLTLKGAGYDADWNPIEVAVADAVVTIDGEKTSFVTNAEGQVTIKVNDPKTCLVSAVGAEGVVLVPPVCSLRVIRAGISAKTAIIAIAVVFVLAAVMTVVGVHILKKTKQNEQ